MELPKEKDIEIVSNENGTAYKFKNGLMIVTQRYEAVMSGLTTQWGGVYYGNAPIPPNFPVAFIEIPVITQMIEANSSNAWLSSNSEANSKTRAPKVQIVRGNSLSSEATFYIDVIAIGKWK